VSGALSLAPAGVGFPSGGSTSVAHFIESNFRELLNEQQKCCHQIPGKLTHAGASGSTPDTVTDSN